MKRLLAAVVLISTCRPAAADDTAGWRFWTAADRLPESFVNAVVDDRAGHVWAIHGSSGMSWTDGYTIDPKVPVLRWPRTLLVASDGVWTVDLGGLQRLTGRRWEFYPIDVLKKMDPMAPAKLRAWGPGRLLIVGADEIGGYDVAARRYTTLVDARRGGLGSFAWIR